VGLTLGTIGTGKELPGQHVRQFKSVRTQDSSGHIVIQIHTNTNACLVLKYVKQQ